MKLDLTGWRTARRYGVPAAMVSDATRRRQAGDWAGACAAAHIDVLFDLPDLRNRYGVELALLLEEDLHHLVPDLVRWHLPRQRMVDDGLLQPSLDVPLARYDGAALWLRTPTHLTRPQRVELHAGAFEFGPTLADNWVETRDLWDDRATVGLRHRVYDGDVELTERVMTLEDAGEYGEAWAAGGIPLTYADPDEKGPVRLDRWYDPSDLYALVPALATAVRRHLSTADGPLALTRPRGYRAMQVVLSVTDTGISAALERYNRTKPLPLIPRSWWHRLPEVDLLRAGRIELSGLHPLVRASLFPGSLDEYQPLDVVESGSVPVRCRGVWHKVGWHGGRVEALDHSVEEARREGVMRSLGGEVPRCFTVAESWRRGESLPKTLRHLRRHGLLALRHGDGAEFNRLLDLGVDPGGIRDRWGRDPLHYLAHVESAPLLHRLLATGLDINRRDDKGRTPLLWVLWDGGSGDLVNAMLDAGADPTIADGFNDTALHMLRSRDARSFLPRLLATGLDLEVHDEYGRTPLLTLVISEAPADAIRALWEAGADPTARDEYSEQSIADLARYHSRTDLDFLPTSEKSDGDD